MKPELLETRDVPLDEIRVDLGDRLRPATEAGIAGVMASIEELGEALQPVMLRRKGSGAGTRLVLIGGLHRLEAYRKLGRETIRADIWRCNDDWARLAQIDENLAGADLSTLELATFLADRKRVYLKLHPETAQGAAGAAARWDSDASDTMSFASSIAEKRDMSKRHVERLIHVGESLDVQAKVLLRQLPKPPGFNDLVRLSECGPMEQAGVVEMMLGVDRPNLKAAIRAVRGETEPPKPAPEDAQFRDLLERFERAKKPAQRRFLSEVLRRFPRLAAEELDRLRREEGA